MKKFIVIIVLLSLEGCDFFEDMFKYRYVEPELRPYVDAFFREARSRGLRFNTLPLIVKFSNLTKNNDGCSLGYLILIDKRSYNENPESLIFHELGHSFLARKHTYYRIGNHGEYAKSIMSGDDWAIYEGPDIYNRRDYYVNELFNPNTKPPEWCLN